MYVLGIDPGLTTGIEILCWALESRPPYDELKGALKQYPEAKIAVEGMPVGSGHNRSVFEEVEEILNKYAASEVHWIRPAEWKPHPHARLLPADLEVLKSPHEKDAAGIARYELAYQQRKEVA
jgi:hypothetical protein